MLVTIHPKNLRTTYPFKWTIIVLLLMDRLQAYIPEWVLGIIFFLIVVSFVVIYLVRRKETVVDMKIYLQAMWAEEFMKKNPEEAKKVLEKKKSSFQEKLDSKMEEKK